jgi:hypothetical protein
MNFETTVKNNQTIYTLFDMLMAHRCNKTLSFWPFAKTIQAYHILGIPLGVPHKLFRYFVMDLVPWYEVCVRVFHPDFLKYYIYDKYKQYLTHIYNLAAEIRTSRLTNQKYICDMHGFDLNALKDGEQEIINRCSNAINATTDALLNNMVMNMKYVLQTFLPELEVMVPTCEQMYEDIRLQEEK